MLHKWYIYGTGLLAPTFSSILATLGFLAVLVFLFLPYGNTGSLWLMRLAEDMNTDTCSGVGQATMRLSS